MLLISQELTIGRATRFMSKVLAPSKEELDWIHSVRFYQMREAPKQPLGWTGAPESALPTVQSVQRALDNNSEAMMWIYNLTVRLLNEKMHRSHLSTVEEATVELTKIVNEVREEARGRSDHAVFLTDQCKKWENVRTIKQGAKVKPIQGFIGYWAFTMRKPLYEHAVNKAGVTPILMSRCNVLRLATSGYAEPWFFDRIPGKGHVDFDASEFEPPDAPPFDNYDKLKSRAIQVLQEVGHALTLQWKSVQLELEQALTAPTTSAASSSRGGRTTGWTSSAPSSSAGPWTTGS